MHSHSRRQFRLRCQYGCSCINLPWTRRFERDGKTSQQIVQAWARLLKAERLALARVETALKQAGLPPLAWYDVLLELERAGEAGLRPFELERALLLAQYNLSRLLDRIERGGSSSARRALKTGGATFCA